MSRKEYQREYHRKWRAANKKRRTEYQRGWYLANREKCLIAAKQRRIFNPKCAKTRVAIKMWRTAHPEKLCEYESRRRAMKIQAIPAWADADLMNDMYAEAAYQGMELDHTVPLNSPKVCGLHWEGNFQLLTPQENASKGNRSWPDMWLS